MRVFGKRGAQEKRGLTCRPVCPRFSHASKPPFALPHPPTTHRLSLFFLVFQERAP